MTDTIRTDDPGEELARRAHDYRHQHPEVAMTFSEALRRVKTTPEGQRLMRAYNEAAVPRPMVTGADNKVVHAAENLRATHPDAPFGSRARMALERNPDLARDYAASHPWPTRLPDAPTNPTRSVDVVIDAKARKLLAEPDCERARSGVSRTCSIQDHGLRCSALGTHFLRFAPR